MWDINADPLSPAIKELLTHLDPHPSRLQIPNLDAWMLWETIFKSLAKVYTNCTHIIKAGVNEIQCSPHTHSCGHFMIEGKQAGQVWSACVKVCWGLSFFFMCPEMDSLIFPETETRLIYKSFPKFSGSFEDNHKKLKPIKPYKNLFHMLLHTKGHHTWHTICKILSHLSCGHLFDHPSLPKIVWGERRGRMWNAHIPLKGNSPSDSREFQSYNNSFCSYCRNPTLSPKSCPSSAALDKKWLCCYWHLVLQACAEFANPQCASTTTDCPPEAIDR